MAKHEVKCRICKRIFDTNQGMENVDWIMPSRNYYYHVDCYTMWKSNRDNVLGVGTDEEWWAITWEFLKVDVRMPNISDCYYKINNQWKSFIKEGKTAKGIYFTLKYYYEIKHGRVVDANKYGIGIVKAVYDQACSYWKEGEMKKAGLIAQLEAEARDKLVQNRIVVREKVKIKKPTVDLSIVEME